MKAAAARAAQADIVVKASGVGYEDDALFSLVLEAARPQALKIFWDVDAPATLAGLAADADAPLHGHLAQTDLVLTYGGGDPVIYGYRKFGVMECHPVYNALDPQTHFPVAPDPRFECALAFLGNRLPDRETRVEEFFIGAASARPRQSFLIGGSGWEDKPMPANIRKAGHVGTGDHNAFNSTPKAVLNVSRTDMAANGFSPATRVFEAAGAAACIITDPWDGIDLFLKPGEEILVARDGHDVADILTAVSNEEAERVGMRALERVLREHTYDKRAELAGCDLQVGLCRQAGGGAMKLDIVIFGLALSSSWGNGHATTYRALIRGLNEAGHTVTFIERDVEWYRNNRDLADPDFCELRYHDELSRLHGWRRGCGAPTR